MATTVNEKIRKVSPARRKKIEARAAELIVKKVRVSNTAPLLKAAIQENLIQLG